MATPKQAHILSTYFAGRYKDKYLEDHKFNRNKARWSWDSVLMDMTPTEAMGLIDYYFSTSGNHRHSMEWFFYNYEKLMQAKATTDEDAKAQDDIRERTRKRVEEWRKKKSV